MNEQQTKYELIEQFLDGNLEEPTLKDFRKQLESDRELQKEVQLHNEIREAINEQETEAFRASLDAIGSAYRRQNEKPVLRPLYRFLYYAAAAAAIFASFLIIRGFTGNSDALTSQELYAKYYGIYEAPGNLRTVAPDKGEIATAFELYNQGKYNEAVPLLESAVANEPERTDILFFLGSSYMAIDDLSHAAICYNKIIRSGEHVFTEQARWYLALIYLKNNEVEASELLLKRIAERKTGKYPEKAKELLESIEQLRKK